jgi:hypothetical protein
MHPILLTATPSATRSDRRQSIVHPENGEW